MAAPTNTAYKGRDILLKISNGLSPATFSTFGGIRSRTITLNNEAVDITDSDTAPHRALLTGAGIKSLSISGTGVFKDDAAFQRIENKCFDANNNEEEFQIVFGNGDIIQGVFHISSLEYAGDYNGEQAYNITLENAGIFTLIRA